MIIPPVKALLFMKAHSERVCDKNIRPLCGRPLFHWIIESLSRSAYIQEIVINTDSKLIACDAQDNFDVTIHMRPDYLLNISNNEAYQLMAYDLKHTEGEFFLQTHSTNPLLRTATINKSIETFFSQQEYDSLFSVTPVQKRYFNESGTAVNHDPDHLIKTQELPFLLEENSCIYLFSREIFLERKNRIGHRPLLFPMDRFESVDIDEEYDFFMAEAMMVKRLTQQEV
jgi:N-acylneuraminate cytidylyltransferase